MYMALYRKYRPLDFSAVVGQDHITSTLKKEIQENKVAHAYLFTGTRGTGKTTCARLLAKAVNCLNLQNGEPCNECVNCKGINEGTILDVIEIDAASNTGVDNIRDIRDEAVYTPASGKKKVYIIDEVHMLSIGAFNALLKLLEEPPEHVMFVLATTEAYKIAPTILSRCQRFDFKRITPADIAGRLQYVCDQEGIKATREGLFLIGRLADGAMRDALSILDTCSGSGEEITYDHVAKTVGITGREHIYRLAQAIGQNDTDTAFCEVEQLYQGCRGIPLLASELTGVLRNMMMVKAVKDPQKVLEEYAYELDTITALSKAMPLERIIYSINLLQDLQNRLQRSQNQRIDFEVCLLQLCSPKLGMTLDSLTARIAALEQQVASGVALAPAAAIPAAQPVQKKQQAKAQEKKEETPPPKPQAPKGEAAFSKLPQWKEIQEGVITLVGAAFGSLLRDAKGYAEGNEIYVVCGNPLTKMKYQEADIRQKVEAAAQSALGHRMKMKALTQEEFEDMGKTAPENPDAFAQFLKDNKENDYIKFEE